MYGLAEGKVKIGQLKSNKPQVLYSTDVYVVALAANPDGTGTVSAHLDGSIHRFIFADAGSTAHAKIAHHPSVPYALAWGRHILVAGNDSQVVFYDQDGGVERTFDYSNDPKCKEFSSAVFNPTGESVVVGNFDSYYVYSLNNRTDTWDDVGVKHVPNLYSVTALAWKRDGSRLAVGALCGVLSTAVRYEATYGDEKQFGKGGSWRGAKLRKKAGDAYPSSAGQCWRDMTPIRQFLEARGGCDDGGARSALVARFDCASGHTFKEKLRELTAKLRAERVGGKNKVMAAIGKVGGESNKKQRTGD